MPEIAASTAGTAKKPRGKPFSKGSDERRNVEGRPMHSRQLLSERFIKELSEDFDKHGSEAIKKMRQEKPDAYVRVVADLMPKDLNVNHTSDFFKKLWQSLGSDQE